MGDLISSVLSIIRIRFYRPETFARSTVEVTPKRHTQSAYCAAPNQLLLQTMTCISWHVRITSDSLSLIPAGHGCHSALCVACQFVTNDLQVGAFHHPLSVWRVWHGCPATGDIPTFLGFSWPEELCRCTKCSLLVFLTPVELCAHAHLGVMWTKPPGATVTVAIPSSF